MSQLGGFPIEDMINATAPKGALSASELTEPSVDKLMDKLMKLQQGKKALEQEVKDLEFTNDSLQRELSTLESEVFQVEEIHKEKDELCRMLQFQCEESEQDSIRQLNQNKNTEEQLKLRRCEIQEYKLKQRKQRMKFENQLHQLMEQHKNLHSVFTPERLPEGLESAESTKRQLQSAEQVKLAQLHKLSEKLEELKTGATETQKE